MYTEMISFENEEVKEKFDSLIRKDSYFEYNVRIIVDTFQNIKILNVLLDKENYLVYFEKNNNVVLVEIDQYNGLHISYIKSENDNNVLSCLDESDHFCRISFRINNLVYEITIYNYLDNIIVDDIVSELQDKNRRMENIRDIYYAIGSVLNVEHSTITIKSLDNKNLLNAHHGTVLNYHEILNMADYQEERYLKDGKYYIERKYLSEQEEIPFVKIKKNGE